MKNKFIEKSERYLDGYRKRLRRIEKGMAGETKNLVTLITEMVHPYLCEWGLDLIPCERYGWQLLHGDPLSGKDKKHNEGIGNSKELFQYLIPHIHILLEEKDHEGKLLGSHLEMRSPLRRRGEYVWMTTRVPYVLEEDFRFDSMNVDDELGESLLEHVFYGPITCELFRFMNAGSSRDKFAVRYLRRYRCEKTGEKYTFKEKPWKTYG